MLLISLLNPISFNVKGWLHTGDIGEWLPNGSLRIIGRRNNVFKLAQGDFVSPEQVENIYLQHPIVKQVNSLYIHERILRIKKLSSFSAQWSPTSRLSIHRGDLLISRSAV